MARPSKSQWDFGELFPPAETRRVFTVSELTQRIKATLESQYGQLWVSGEISNLRVQASGHCYFTLKDPNAQLSCVLFRGDARLHRDLLADGRKVLLHGELTVYEPRGQYQLIVDTVEPLGLGPLQLAFERLKQQLQTEGLFDPARKRPIPRLPEAIGVVTSPTGAALRDVLHVVARRYPALQILLAPCRVQGEGAAAEIVQAIQSLNAWHASRLATAPTTRPGRSLPPLGCILVTRGGGSLEDLWAFNEEIVARAIAASALPVISAVGHEIDFTISDFVADLRAATPSAAAEILTAGAVSAREFLSTTATRLQNLARQRLVRENQQLAARYQRLLRAHPRRRVRERAQRLDDLRAGLTTIGRLRLDHARLRWQNVRGRWLRVQPQAQIRQHWERLDRSTRRLAELARARLQDRRQAWTRLEAKLQLLSPRHALARGYSITADADTGRILRSVGETRAGQKLTTQLRDGQVRSVVG